MPVPRIHLIAPAGSCGPFLSAIKFATPAELIGLVQETVGSRYVVTANETLLTATEDELHGGRTDDGLRADDLQQALADSDVTAIVALRGGAWFTRILPSIDFTVLDHRTTRVAVFGFSELTALVNIVGAHPRGLGVYYMGPAFLPYGLTRYAVKHLRLNATTAPTSRDWMQSRLHEEFRRYFATVTSILETSLFAEARSEPITLTARCVRGTLDEKRDVVLVGGNLTVLSTMIGSMYHACIAPKGRWLLLEDFNDKPERLDRFLAHLTLARFWDRLDGVLLGDFHQEERDLLPAVLEMLDYHLPRRLPLTVLVADSVGHTWPMTPVPLHRSASLSRGCNGELSIRWSLQHT